MISKTCARLLLIVGVAGVTQVHGWAQATMNAADSQFGAGAAPYGQTPQAQPVQRAVPIAESASGVYAQPAYAPQMEVGSLGAPDPTKPLGRGDIVTFAIAQDREAPQTMRVTDTGELDFSAFPKIGRISVAGRTCASVAEELKRRLEADYYYKADVTLGINQVNHLDSRGKVYVTGNVNAPGPQDLLVNDRTMVSTAIIRAGGFAKFANQRKVQVTRKDASGKTVRFTVDVKSIIEGGHLERDVELQDGDYINVPQNVVNF